MIYTARKKPVKIQAIKVPPEGVSFNEMEVDWIQKIAEERGVEAHDVIDNGFDGKVIIHTLEGDMTGEPGDYIIRGVKGELYPCKPDIWADTYEVVAVNREGA